MTVAATPSPARADFPPAGLFADPLVDRIAGFLRAIGLTIEATTLDEPTPMPGMTVRWGRLLVDEAKLAYPGDLLHEAGHLAVMAPAARATQERIQDDLGEEIAAQAWSYAAARALDIDPAVVFHGHGYQGSGEALLAAYASPGAPGAPLLAYYGMTVEPKADSGGPERFPHMRRWLR